MEALSALAARSVMSAPVIDPTTGRLVGMLDYRDFCALVCRAYFHIKELSKLASAKSVKTEGKYSVSSESTLGEQSGSISPIPVAPTLSQLLRYAPAGEVANFSRRDGFYSVPYSGSMLDAVELFAKGMHRAVVLHPDGRFAGVVSQSDALRLLNKHLGQPEYKDFAHKTLTELGLKRKTEALVTASEGTSVAAALELMQARGVSSIALVNGNGITGCFSMNDFKYIIQRELKVQEPKDGGTLIALLEGSCGALLSEIMLARDREAGYETRLPVFHCSPETTAARVVGMLCATRTHRLWVTEEKTEEGYGHPVAIVTLSDILHAAIPVDSAHFDKLREKGFKPIEFTPATSTYEQQA